MTRTLIIASLVAITMGAIIAYICGVTGNWADITLVSVSTEQSGQVLARFEIRHANGVGIEMRCYSDGVAGGGLIDASSGYAFMPASFEQIESFDSPLFRRLLIRAGETQRVRLGETLYLYDFVDNGRRRSLVFRPIVLNSPLLTPPPIPRPKPRRPNPRACSERRHQAPVATGASGGRRR